MRSADVIAKVGPHPIQPDEIFCVVRLRDESLERFLPKIYADMYEVRSATHEDFTGRGGGGHLLHVKIRNGRVELHGWSTWMS